MENHFSKPILKEAHKKLLKILTPLGRLYFGVPSFILLTPGEFRAITGVSKPQVKRWRKMGHIRYYFKFGNKILYPLEELLRIMAELGLPFFDAGTPAKVFWEEIFQANRLLNKEASYPIRVYPTTGFPQDDS